ncbi:hypothetical protein THAOC_08324 [Thalassiosira oceanica]|uniref:Uncharacterized protein n=1 Tax=Thalassiosira oceanica TaxID=159749 RepID=K0TAA0_THAOC|nr:hypothetical protein THAOC_08324 [Thalassiosira oceanica]|eukprot:EJK70326.1 hypothetical protein THAOC_08324 [Thalassiosira oceanica]
MLHPQGSVARPQPTLVPVCRASSRSSPDSLPSDGQRPNWATGWLRGGRGSPGRLEVLGTAQHDDLRLSSGGVRGSGISRRTSPLATLAQGRAPCVSSIGRVGWSFGQEPGGGPRGRSLGRRGGGGRRLWDPDLRSGPGTPADVERGDGGRGHGGTSGRGFEGRGVGGGSARSPPSSPRRELRRATDMDGMGLRAGAPLRPRIKERQRHIAGRRSRELDVPSPRHTSWTRGRECNVPPEGPDEASPPPSVSERSSPEDPRRTGEHLHAREETPLAPGEPRSRAAVAGRRSRGRTGTRRRDFSPVRCGQTRERARPQKDAGAGSCAEIDAIAETTRAKTGQRWNFGRDGAVKAAGSLWRRGQDGPAIGRENRRIDAVDDKGRASAHILARRMAPVGGERQDPWAASELVGGLAANEEDGRGTQRGGGAPTVRKRTRQGGFRTSPRT